MNTVPSTPAETIRRAAALIRQRAEAAREAAPGTWTVDQSPDDGLIVAQHQPDDVDPDSGYISKTVIAFFAYPGDEDRRTYRNADEVAAHIASLSPVVALLIADWLEYTASRAEKNDFGIKGLISCARAFARAYLREEAQS